MKNEIDYSSSCSPAVSTLPPFPRCTWPSLQRYKLHSKANFETGFTSITFKAQGLKPGGFPSYGSTGFSLYSPTSYPVLRSRSASVSSDLQNSMSVMAYVLHIAEVVNASSP